MNDKSPAISATLRSPDDVMRLERLGSFHQCRLSFMRQLTRRMAREKWKFERLQFDIDDQGEGIAIYCAKAPKHNYSLVAFAHNIDDKDRSDRVIAETWDATFTLVDGIPTKDDIKRLAKNVPLQEKGRVSEQEISLSRANRSVRMWQYVVDCLAKGLQPDAEKVAEVGYLMRTTAVYGSGKFGANDYANIAERPEFSSPFQAEMLSVFLTRAFIRDLANHVAKTKGGDKAIALDDSIATRLGIGNATGLGMAPYLINHPILLHSFINARESAIAKVKSIKKASKHDVALFLSLYDRSKESIGQWYTDHQLQQIKLDQLNQDLYRLDALFSEFNWRAELPWQKLCNWVKNELSIEGQEFIHSLMLEPYGKIIDDYGSTMSNTNTRFIVDGSQSVKQVLAAYEKIFGSLIELDYKKRQNCARIWYTSAEKLEPRLGERFEEPLDDYEQPLAPARDAASTYKLLSSYDDATRIGKVLSEHPEIRLSIKRVQIAMQYQYSEIRDNTISADLLPIDMLRAKLSFFGATHFNPRSDRWVQIRMFQGAPYPETLNVENSDLWIYPTI